MADIILSDNDGANITLGVPDSPIIDVEEGQESSYTLTDSGARGDQGPAGPGVPTGGTSGQVLQKSSGVDYDTTWHTLTASEVLPSQTGNSGKYLTTDGSNPSWATAASGGVSRSISSISSPTTAGSTASTDYVYLVSGTTTLTLPTAVSNTNRYSVTNVGTDTVTVATTSAQAINGSSTATLPIANMSLDFISNGSNWVVE